MDTQLLSYSIYQAFTENLKIEDDESCRKLIKKGSRKYDDLDENEKLYYSNYALKIAKSLLNHVGKINTLVIMEENGKYSFKLVQKKSERIVHIVNTNIATKSIIPEKMWKVCGYRKNTNVSHEFIDAYLDINEKFMEKVEEKEYVNYSEVSEKIIEKFINKPICSLIADSFTKKRKCATELFNYIFPYYDEIYVKAYKTRYAIYDFATEIPDPESIKLTYDDEESNKINLNFNNNAQFVMILKTNSSKIREKLSLKFTINFKNIDDIFCIECDNV